MTEQQQAAMRQAAEDVSKVYDLIAWGHTERAADILKGTRTALRRALEQQPADEPVACVGPWHDARLTLIPRYSGQVFERNQPLYTRPQPATWVGLTDEEFKFICDNSKTPAVAINMTEAKLREKNS